MEKNKLIFGFTLLFSIILEWFVRKGAVLLYGESGFLLWPWVDNFMHFFWGFNIFLFLYLILKWDPWDALLGVVVWQLAWEVLEIIGDRVTSQPDSFYDHFFFDGVKDSVVDALGALFAWRLFAWNTKPLQAKQFRGFMERLCISSALLIIAGSVIILYGLYAGRAFESPDLFAVFWILASVIMLGTFELVKKK
jgi:hypothetical protein